jgi:hypothetical protein
LCSGFFVFVFVVVVVFVFTAAAFSLPSAETKPNCLQKKVFKLLANHDGVVQLLSWKL